MNAITEVSKADVSFVEELESVMLITAKSVRFKRRTETVVQRLST